MRQFKRIIARTSLEMYGGRVGECHFDKYGRGYYMLMMLDHQGNVGGNAVLHELLPFIALAKAPTPGTMFWGNFHFLNVDVLEKYCEEPFYVIPTEILSLGIKWQNIAGNRETFGDAFASIVKQNQYSTVGEFLFDHDD